MVKHLLFLCLLLSAFETTMAQIPNACPSNNIPAADNCPDACIYCNLESYVGTTVGYSAGIAPGFCGTIESEQWLGFVAGTDNATITVVPSNCVLGNGVQVALYEACFGFPIPNGCDGGFNGGGDTPVSVTVDLIPGTVYYLMVDSWAGDLCDFSLSITPPGAAIGIQFQTQEILFCPGDVVVIDGITFTEPGTYIDTIPSVTSSCDTIRTYALSHLPQPKITKTFVLQAGEPVTIGGNNYFAPDTVLATIPASAGCDTLATYLLLLDPVVPDTCTETQSFLKLLGEAAAAERGEVLCPSGDGNFYIAGEKGANSLLMKVTPDGEILWSRSFQPVPQMTTHITDLNEDSDNMLVGCAIVGDGNTNLKSYAFRYNPLTGNMIWSRLLEQQSPEAFAILEKTPGGNFLLLTSPQLTLNVDDAEIWELNRDNGTLIGGLANRYNYGVSDVWNSMVVQNGALFVVGRHIASTQTVPIPVNKMRMGLSRIDVALTGAPVWSRLGHPDTSATATLFGQDLLIHDNALLSIYNGNDSGDPDAAPAFFLQKTTLDGDLLWVKRYDTPTPAGILASDIQKMSDGYIIAGWAILDSAWNKVVTKTDFDGNVIWAKRVGNTSPSNIGSAFNLGQHQSAVVNDVLYLATTSAATPTDAVFLKMTSDGEVSDICDLVESFPLQMEAIPNPVNTVIQVPVNQFISQNVNATVAIQASVVPVVTYCVSCLLDCDDTLDLGPDIILCIDSTLTFNAGSSFVSYLWQDGSTDSTYTTDEPGIYWVEVTNECGDIQRDSVFLSFSLVGDVKLNDTTLCIGESVTIEVPGFDTYDWSPSAGLSCDTCATVVVQPDITTTYTLYAENAAGCTKADTFTVVVLPLQTRAETVEFCPGESVTIGGVEYTQSGTVIDTIPGTVGCDTIVTYTLTLLPYNFSAVTLAFCPGESVTIDGVEYTQSGTVIDTTAGITGCDTIVTYTLTLLPYNLSAVALEFCPGESVTIDGVVYTQSGTVIDTIAGAVGCDTIVTYTLTLLPYNLSAVTLEFCPGESVTIDGVVYTQSGTVIDTIAGTVGCDTIVTYTLILLPQPTRSETVEFCSGESVTIGGNVYTQPGIVIDTIPASVGCDTVVTYTLQFIDTPNSSVSIDCPANIDVAVNPGSGPVVVNYNLPTVSSDCECPGIALALTQGLASGSLFPVSVTTVCYAAKDSCGNTASCCFEVSVHEDSPCDVKTIGCMKYELLSIMRGSSSLNLTYRIRVTNTCANKLIYTAIQIPDGMVAEEPANNSVFTAGSGRQYDVRNPNYSPFYSVRFKSKLDSIANGQSDVFEYTLPPQINPAYIHVTSRLYPQIFHEAHLNTFYCPIEIVQDKPAQRIAAPGSSNLTNFKVFPNPTNGRLFADFSDWQGEQLQVQVFSSQGQRVQLLTVQAGDMPQPVELPEGLSAGLYFLEVLRENGEKQTVRFVVQH